MQARLHISCVHCAAITIFATLVNIQTDTLTDRHRQTDRQHLISLYE